MKAIVLSLPPEKITEEKLTSAIYCPGYGHVTYYACCRGGRVEIASCTAINHGSELREVHVEEVIGFAKSFIDAAAFIRRNALIWRYINLRRRQDDTTSVVRRISAEKLRSARNVPGTGVMHYCGYLLRLQRELEELREERNVAICAKKNDISGVFCAAKKIDATDRVEEIVASYLAPAEADTFLAALAAIRDERQSRKKCVDNLFTNRWRVARLWLTKKEYNYRTDRWQGHVWLKDGSVRRYLATIPDDATSQKFCVKIDTICEKMEKK